MAALAWHCHDLQPRRGLLEGKRAEFWWALVSAWRELRPRGRPAGRLQWQFPPHNALVAGGGGASDSIGGQVGARLGALLPPGSGCDDDEQAD